MKFILMSVYSLIITISQKKCFDVSVNINLNGGKSYGDNYAPNGDIHL